MKYIAHFFSILLHPLLMPFYGMVIILTYSYLSIFPLNFKIAIASVVLLFTGAIPAISIGLLYKLGKITSIDLNIRQERPLPYLITIISYLLCGLFFYKIQLPLWLLFYIGGALTSILIAAIINNWWKISAHMTGIGGVLATGFALARIQHQFPIGLFVLLILLTGMLGTSRIALKRHTFLQVLAGTANGFICVYLSVVWAI